jgi:hypothetical protein
VIVANRIGDGLVSFEHVDECRIQAEDDASGGDRDSFRRCAAGGVLSYFGMVLAWIISLPKLHFVRLQTWEGIVLLLATLCTITGAIVLWYTRHPALHLAPEAAGALQACPTAMFGVPGRRSLWSLRPIHRCALSSLIPQVSSAAKAR